MFSKTTKLGMCINRKNFFPVALIVKIYMFVLFVELVATFVRNSISYDLKLLKSEHLVKQNKIVCYLFFNLMKKIIY